MDEHDHATDWFGSERKAPLIVEDAYALLGSHQGSICVHGGGHLVLEGTQMGSVSLRPGSKATVAGNLNGSLNVAGDSSVEVRGAVNGSIHVASGGAVLVSHTGRLAGSLAVDGLVQNEGIRGGSVSGSGEIRDVNGGCVKEPVIENGMPVYHW